MKRSSLLCSMLAAVSLLQAQSAGFLRARNARIVDGQGQEIILRGMGLGGWMLQEGYMLGIRNEGTQHSIKARIVDLIGKADCDKFYQLWLQNHMNREDVDLLAKSGFNSIRLPMHFTFLPLPLRVDRLKAKTPGWGADFELQANLRGCARATGCI